MDIWVGFESVENADNVFNWHHGYCSAYGHLLSQQTIDTLEELIENNQLIVVKNNADGTYIGQLYFTIVHGEVFLGGLMLDKNYRKIGFGLFIVALVIALIYSNYGIKTIKAKIVDNNKSTNTITKSLKVIKTNNIKEVEFGIHENKETYLAIEYIFQHPESLLAVISILEDYKKRLLPTLASGLVIDLFESNDLKKWCSHLKKLVI